MKRFHSLIPLLTLIAIILVSLSASCDKRNPPPIVPEPVPDPPISELRIIHSIKATPDTIYADNNITYSQVSVEIRDGEGFGVPGQLVQFKTSPIGRVLTNVTTDSTGVATTTFWDDGQQGIATITAIVRKYHASIADSLVSADTLATSVTVLETPAIDNVTLHFDNLADPFPMKVGQTTPIYATAVNTLGNNVPNGTLITFECIKGKFVDAAGNDLGKYMNQATYNGRASVFYNSGTSATTNPESVPEFVTARIGEKSSTRGILIRPGTPFAIELKSLVVQDGVETPANTVPVGSPNEIYMEATLSDLYNNTCHDQEVKFSTDLGTFLNTTQTVSIPTDQYGVSRVRFTPGLFAGAATIRATALNDTLQTQVIFTITSDQIHSIGFTQESLISLNVANTGGTQSAVLRVKLRDINGNLIDSPLNVYFRIMNPINPNNPNDMNDGFPNGANLNNAAATDSVMVTSNGGEAQVSVNAGTESGILIIRASCTTPDGRWIQATKPNIIILAGPPHTIVPFLSGFNTGTNLGGGVWRIVAGAHVRDLWNNPVQRNTAVWFSIYGPNAGPGYEPPTDAQIEAIGSVGNVSVNGDSLEGVAYTTITYNGILTNEMVTIKARSGDGVGNSVEQYFSDILPLNDPRFEIQVIPQFVNFGQTAPLNKEADLEMTLRDGQGLNVSGSTILLLSTRGEIIFHTGHLGYPNYQDVPPVANRVTTYDGVAYGRIKVYLNEYPFGDAQTNTPSTTDVGITGRLMGTNVQATTNLLVYRYPGTPPF